MKAQPHPHPTDETEAIRSEINTTRHRMDETIDALGQRLKGRHLLDEALHIFRKQQENGNMTKLTNKISQSADTAYHSVVDTIKAHPVPIALVGAGVGWLIYERSRSSSSSSDISQYRVRSSSSYENDFSPGALSGSSIDTGDMLSEEECCQGSSSSSSVKEKASQAMGTLQQKASQVRDRLAESGTQAKERTRQLYTRSRERVGTAIEQHPLQSGLVCLAVGLLAGMLIPTPRRLSQRLEPTARGLNERVRDKAQDLVERGTHVVESATEAAKQEAKAQGFVSGEGAASDAERKDRSVSAI